MVENVKSKFRALLDWLPVGQYALGIALMIGSGYTTVQMAAQRQNTRLEAAESELKAIRDFLRERGKERDAQFGEIRREMVTKSELNDKWKTVDKIDENLEYLRRAYEHKLMREAEEARRTTSQ